MNLPHVLLPRPHRLSRASFSLGGASLEFMVAHLLTEHYQGSGYTLDQVKSFNDGLRLQLREGAFGVSDPAMSDAWSAELEAAADRILSGVEDWMAKDENS